MTKPEDHLNGQLCGAFVMAFISMLAAMVAGSIGLVFFFLVFVEVLVVAGVVNREAHERRLETDDKSHD